MSAAVFSAVSPHWAFKFLIHHGHNGWVMLGGVLLCVTGAEAMYADLGHFTRVSIQANPFSLRPVRVTVSVVAVDSIHQIRSLKPFPPK